MNPGRTARAILWAGVFILFSCGGGKKEAQDADADLDTDLDVEAEAEGEVPVDGVDGDDGDGDFLPLPCAVDSDCTDNDPCNGNERCNEETLLCAAGEFQPDGVICSLDPRRICLAGACSESLCGDGFLDTGSDEFCEPPGEGDCDEECLIFCEGDPDCASDANPCNGLEYCSTDTSRCSRLDRPEDGQACSLDPRGICLGGICTHSLCGDGFVDAGGGEFCEPPYTATCDGGCLLLCGGDPDCLDDGEICNGIEYCDPDTSRCSRQSIPPAGTACDDHDPETSPDLCDGAGACVGETQCVPGSFVSVAAGNSHTCALLLTGGVQCWGYNASGQLGDGTVEQRLTPVDVAGLASGMDRVETGYWHSCALPAAGGMLCWGANGSGQLGDGSLVDMITPVEVAGLASGVWALTAGRGHTCALLSSGGVQCWGNNRYGQLGDGSTTRRTAPVSVTGLASAAAAIAAGDFYTCAVLDTGAAQCWGINETGQLGNGTTTDSPVPVDVAGLASGAAAVTAGEEHTCALLASGGVRCWGMGGLLGDGTTTDSPVPVDVTGLASSASAVDAGSRHTCALLDSGGVQCWGQNGSGQLGDGTTTTRLAAVQVADLASGVAAVAAGADHTCAVTDTGAVLCWGLNSNGQLGNGTTTSSLTAADVVPCP